VELKAQTHTISPGQLGAKWAQNSGFQTQIDGWPVSKGSRINGNFAGSWSGRWESNKSE
jgi:hypothetical protein